MITGEWSDLPLVLTTEQAAAVLQLNRRTVSNMLDRGELNGVKIGKEWRVSRAEVRHFVERRAQTVARTRKFRRASQSAGPRVIDKDGVRVFTGALEGDIDDIVRREREERITDLLRQAGL